MNLMVISYDINNYVNNEIITIGTFINSFYLLGRGGDRKKVLSEDVKYLNPVPFSLNTHSLKFYQI